MSPLCRMRIQYLPMTSPLPGNAPWTMKINTPKFNMCPTFVQRRPRRSLITTTTMTLRRPVVTAVTNQPDHITTVLPQHNKKGGGQKPKLTWTIHIAWRQFSSTTMQQKRGWHKLNLHELPYWRLFPCFHCMWEVFHYVGVLDSLSLADILAGAYFSQQENLRFRIHLLSQ